MSPPILLPLFQASGTVTAIGLFTTGDSCSLPQTPWGAGAFSLPSWPCRRLLLPWGPVHEEESGRFFFPFIHSTSSVSLLLRFSSAFVEESPFFSLFPFFYYYVWNLFFSDPFILSSFPFVVISVLKSTPYLTSPHPPPPFLVPSLSVTVLKRISPLVYHLSHLQILPSFLLLII